jgi:hypothetical protein
VKWKKLPKSFAIRLPKPIKKGIIIVRKERDESPPNKIRSNGNV